jgi:hypothetical protein
MKEDKSKLVQLGAPDLREELPFRVELWHDGAGESVERLLARAASAPLGRAIFKAALSEHPNRRITLRRGSRVIADSSKS